MIRWILAALALLALALPAAAQPTAPPVSAQNPVYTYCWNGSAVVMCPTTGGSIQLTPPTGTPTQVSVSCGITSTTLLAASAATMFILIKNPSGGGTVWVNTAGVAAVAAPPSIDLVAGASLAWSPVQGFVPSSQINCIAAVATTVTVVYK
jgi:hypothetical protein